LKLGVLDGGEGGRGGGGGIVHADEGRTDGCLIRIKHASCIRLLVFENLVPTEGHNITYT
jgi:hypothetical protein